MSLKILFYLLNICLLTSCSSIVHPTISKIAGVYRWEGIYGVGSAINLHEDKTFDYHWQAGLNEGITTGTWEIKGNKITLNSQQQPFPGGASYRITHTQKSPSDFISIKVVDIHNAPLPMPPYALLKTDTTYIAGALADFEGEIRLPKQPADSLIIIWHSGGGGAARCLLNQEISRYEFQVIANHYEFFTNEILKYKNGNLYFKDFSNGQYLNYYTKISK